MQYLTSCFLGLLLTVGIANNLNAQDPSRVFRFDYNGETVNLLTLMKTSNTPAISMAIDNGQIDSAFTANTAKVANLDTGSLFPAGAASALPVCVAVLQLVERGVFDLNAPINTYLEAGKLAGGESVTLRDRLADEATHGKWL